MLRLGWQTWRRTAGEVLAPARLRRALVVSVLAVVVAAAGVTALEVSRHWTGRGVLGSAVVIALLSLGIGLVVSACFPLARPVDPVTTINGRQVRPDTARTVRTSVRKYLTRRPPPIDPDDRQAVLTDTRLFRRGVTVDLTRASALVAGGILASIAGAMVGFTHLWPAFMAVYAANLPSALVQLGRAERAHRAAEALTPTGAAVPPPT